MIKSVASPGAPTTKVPIDEQVVSIESSQEDDRNLVFDSKVSVSLLRAKVFQSNEFPVHNDYESFIFQLFQKGDYLYQIIPLKQTNMNNRIWIKSTL